MSLPQMCGPRPAIVGPLRSSISRPSVRLALLFLCLLLPRASRAGQLAPKLTSPLASAVPLRAADDSAPRTAAQSRHTPRSAYASSYGYKVPRVFGMAGGLSELFSRFSLTSKRVQNELCRNHSMMYLRELHNFTLWAVEMFDASAKFPEGLLAGNTYHMGIFDECIAVKAQLPSGHENESGFTGQYCLADVQILPPETDSSYHTYEYIKDPNGSAWEGLKVASFIKTGDPRVRRRDVFHWAFCIPSSCRASDLQVALEEAFEWVEREHGISMVVEVQDRMCQTDRKPPITSGAIVLIVIISLSVVAVVAGTVFDIFSKGRREENPSISSRAAICFSIRANLRTLMKTDSSKGELKVIHGVRFYSMLLIIFGHRFMFSVGGPLHNPRAVENIYTEFLSMNLLNGLLAVDTFFLISGFLTCYLLILELEKKKKFKIFVLYLYRYIRLTPVYAIMVAFCATLLHQVNNGPLWKKKVSLEAERCEANWWTNLLYLNNYVNTSQLCLPQTWYLACDMHFFLLAPLLIYPLWRWPTFGRAALFLVTLVSIVVQVTLNYIGQLEGVLFHNIETMSDPVLDDTFRSIYITSHTRASPYFIGMLWGYVYYKIKTEKLRIPQFVNLGLFIVLLTTVMASIFAAWILLQLGRSYSPLESALYGGLHTTGWGLSLGWLILVCDIRPAGRWSAITTPLTSLFTWNAVVPLSRLTYCAFLIHGGVQFLSIATLRTPEYMTFYKLFWMTSADICFTFMIALLVSLVFESPICSLQKIIMRVDKNEGKETIPETALVSNVNSHTQTIPQ